MLRKFVLGFGLLCFSNFAFGDNEAKVSSENETKTVKSEWKLESDSSFKFLIAFALGANSEHYKFGLESPSFASHFVEKYIVETLGIYLDYDTIIVKKIHNTSTGILQDSPNRSLSFGLVSRLFPKEDFAIFTKLGPTRYWIDPDLSDKGGAWGLHIEVGAEHLFTIGRYVASGRAIKHAMFSSFSYDSVHAEANKLANSPKIFDNLALNFGMRLHF